MIHCVIYGATNQVNYDSYIGQSDQYLKRWKDHSKINDGTYFHNALRKYGYENFCWEIIEEKYIEDKNEATEWMNDRERYWIKYFHTYYRDPEYSGGYNRTPGGETMSIDCLEASWSPENKAKMVATNRSNGFYESDDFKKFMQAGQTHDSVMKAVETKRESGYYQSEKHKEILRKAIEASKSPESRAKMIATMKDNGTFSKVMESLHSDDSIKKAHAMYDWLTPTGDIVRMSRQRAKSYHPDWIQLGLSSPRPRTNN